MKNYVDYTTDENYWMPLYISIYSLLRNNPNIEFEIFIISENKNDKFVKNISDLHEISNNVKINFVIFNRDLFNTAPKPKHLSKGIYYRILLGSLLSIEEVNPRILYLDCDTLVTDPIQELFNINLNGNVIAAVPHFKLNSVFYGHSVDNLWYNTGVMLIDLKKWREFEIETACLTYINNNEGMDQPLQEILNDVLHENELWTSLHPKYNMMTEWITAYNNHEHTINEKIIHFEGRNKPWHYRTVRPYKKTWWEYLKATPYQNYTPPDKNIKNIAISKIDKKLQSYPLIRETVKPIYSHLTSTD